MKDVNKVFRDEFGRVREKEKPLLSSFSVTEGGEQACFMLVGLPQAPLRLGPDRLRVYRCRLLKEDLEKLTVSDARDFLKKVRAEVLQEMSGAVLVDDVEFGLPYEPDTNSKEYFLEIGGNPGERSSAPDVEFRVAVRFR